MDHETLSAKWVAQRPVENEFLSSQPLIITIMPGHNQTSGGGVSCLKWRTTAPIRVSQYLRLPSSPGCPLPRTYLHHEFQLKPILIQQCVKLLTEVDSGLAVGGK